MAVFPLSTKKRGSPDFAVKGTRFGGESVRTHALTPKSGYITKIPREPEKRKEERGKRRCGL